MASPLNLAYNRNSPVHSAIGTPSRINALRLLVGTRFQVLFHSPSGVLSPFPHGTGSLSVTREYLALPDGPGGFQRNFSCSAVLRIHSRGNLLSITGLLPPMAELSSSIHLKDLFLT